MQRPLKNEYNPSYQKYFDRVPRGSYPEVLKQNKKNVLDFFEAIPFEKLDYKYAPGKWTIKEILLHIIDTERIFSARALMAARSDSATPVQRMDEELYAKNAIVTNRSLQSLITEFNSVRNATETLFENFSEEQSKFLCNIISYPMTARAIGYFIIGHSEHHINIIKEKYLQAEF